MKPVRIGGGSAFFIDSAIAVPQLLDAGVDYIILDYLAEGAMGLLGRMRLADPQSGYPGDFLDVHIGPWLDQIAQSGVRIIANAGGVNPAALVAKLRDLIAEQGLTIKVACIDGDDLIDAVGDFSEIRDMFTGAPFPTTGITSCNAYLGAFPIAHALSQGAQIVITGRVVDSALALGALIHEYGWARDDWDRLAAGTVVGHLIECGAQVTGGTFTDWRTVEGWANIGSPIAECSADGSCIITKPDGSGGMVSFGTVAEQLLYEVGDPQAYFVPDVTCDLTTVRIEDLGGNRVRVAGATGYPPPETLKACVTFDHGWRGIACQPVIGPDARTRAAKQAAALFERGTNMLRAAGLADWRRTEAVLFGGDEQIIVKLVVEHDVPRAVQMFVREQFAAISAMAPGTSVAFGVQVAPMLSLNSFTVARDRAVPRVDGIAFADPPLPYFKSTMIKRPEPGPQQVATTRAAPLEALAWARSGEKGETINIGVIARDPDHLAALRAGLTQDALRAALPDLGAFVLTIFEVPGINALNLMLDGALPGGLNASQRFDPAAKSIAQRLMAVPIALCD